MGIWGIPGSKKWRSLKPDRINRSGNPDAIDPESLGASACLKLVAPRGGLGFALPGLDRPSVHLIRVPEEDGAMGFIQVGPAFAGFREENLGQPDGILLRPDQR